MTFNCNFNRIKLQVRGLAYAVALEKKSRRTPELGKSVEVNRFNRLTQKDILKLAGDLD